MTLESLAQLITIAYILYIVCRFAYFALFKPLPKVKDSTIQRRVETYEAYKEWYHE